MIRLPHGPWCPTIGLCLAIAAPVALAQRVGPFDFDYRITGHPDARPQQVFDDGSGKTYFQFKPGATVPVILVGAGPAVQMPAAEGPYHVVGGRARDYTLVVPAGTARVRHAAVLSGAQPASHHPEAAAPTSPISPATYRASDRTVSSYATPVRGDVIEWAEPDLAAGVDVDFRGQSAQLPGGAVDRLAASARTAGPSSQVLIESSALHPPALLARRTTSLRRALSQVGVPASQVIGAPAEAAGSSLAPLHARKAVPALGRDVLRVRWRPAPASAHAKAPGLPTAAVRPPTSLSAEPVPPNPAAGMGRPVAGQFDLLLSDGTVAVAMKRWAIDAGYDIHWDTAVHAPVTGELTLDASSFPDAAERVIAGLRASGYPLQLTPISGRTLRVMRVE